MGKTKSLEKTLMLGKMKAGETGTTEYEMLYGITDSMDMNLSRLQEFGDGQGSLTCFSPRLHMSQTGLNSTECFILFVRLLVHRDINKLI